MHDLIRRMSIPCHPEQPRHQVMERHFCFAKWFKEPTPELMGTWYWSHPQCWESFTSKTPKQLKIPKCPTDYGNGGSIFGGPEKNSMGNWFPLICNFLQGASAAAPKPISLQFDPRSLASHSEGKGFRPRRYIPTIHATKTSCKPPMVHQKAKGLHAMHLHRTKIYHTYIIRIYYIESDWYIIYYIVFIPIITKIIQTYWWSMGKPWFRVPIFWETSICMYVYIYITSIFNIYIYMHIRIYHTLSVS